MIPSEVGTLSTQRVVYSITSGSDLMRWTELKHTPKDKMKGEVTARGELEVCFPKHDGQQWLDIRANEYVDMNTRVAMTSVWLTMDRDSARALVQHIAPKFTPSVPKALRMACEWLAMNNGIADPERLRVLTAVRQALTELNASNRS